MPVPAPRVALSAALAAALVALPAGPAGAKDLGGKLGIGVEQSIGGVSGAALRYWPGQAFGFLVTFGGNFSTFEYIAERTGDDDEVTRTTETGLATAVDLSIGFVYNFARSLHANLGIGLRGALGFRTAQAQRQAAIRAGETDPDALEALDGGTEFAIEVPLTVEFFLSDSFSVSASTGLLFSLVPAEGPILEGEGLSRLTPDDTWGITLGAGSVTGTLGVVYYF